MNNSNVSADDARAKRQQILTDRLRDKRFQRGIEFPKAGKQQHILIIRLDLTAPDKHAVKSGLKRLCTLLDRLDNGEKKIDKLDGCGITQAVKISDPETFNFSSTVGFGIGFFDKLGIVNLRPSKLTGMPDHEGLGDPTPYSLPQTDLIIQLGSNSDFVNRWVFQNTLQPANNQPPEDIVCAVNGWATIADIHSGFQRIDGRNLMGFNDGVSNPNPGAGFDGFDKYVWNNEKDEGQLLKDSTYMIFQKISHDLDQWEQLDTHEQEEWVGRDKVTGLLLGSKENTPEFKEKVRNGDPDARRTLRDLLEVQSDPTKAFYDCPVYRDNVAAWAHVRKANPRGEKLENAHKSIPIKIIFRRGYPFIETSLDKKLVSGLLFISFQRDISTFEFIKKNFLNSKKFPVPDYREFSDHEKNVRSSQGRFSKKVLNDILANPSQKTLLGLDDPDVLQDVSDKSDDPDTQYTGRDGLAGPSELGVNPTGEFLAIVPFGGGYYFIPPIPNKNISEIGQQFFEQAQDSTADKSITPY